MLPTRHAASSHADNVYTHKQQAPIVCMHLAYPPMGAYFLSNSLHTTKRKYIWFAGQDIWGIRDIAALERATCTTCGIFHRDIACMCVHNLCFPVCNLVQMWSGSISWLACAPWVSLSLPLCCHPLVNLGHCQTHTYVIRLPLVLIYMFHGHCWYPSTVELCADTSYYYLLVSFIILHLLLHLT